MLFFAMGDGKQPFSVKILLWKVELGKINLYLSIYRERFFDIGCNRHGSHLNIHIIHIYIYTSLRAIALLFLNLAKLNYNFRLNFVQYFESFVSSLHGSKVLVRYCPM